MLIKPVVAPPLLSVLDLRSTSIRVHLMHITPFLASALSECAIRKTTGLLTRRYYRVDSSQDLLGIGWKCGSEQYRLLTLMLGVQLLVFWSRVFVALGVFVKRVAWCLFVVVYTI